MFHSKANRVLSVCRSHLTLLRRCSVLESQGYQVASCAEPEEAYALAASETFRLLIVGNGFQFSDIRELVRLARERQIPVLLVGEGDATPHGGVTACLPRTHDAEQLTRVVGWLVWR